MKKINENIETFENSELFEDKELDQLICDTFEREHIVDDISRQVMKEVKSLKKSPFSLRNILFAFENMQLSVAVRAERHSIISTIFSTI